MPREPYTQIVNVPGEERPRVYQWTFTGEFGFDVVLVDGPGAVRKNPEFEEE